MKILLIFNPTDGGGKAYNKIEIIKELFISSGVDFDLILTKHKGHATEIVINSNLSNYDGIVAAGGDGTFFEVLNGYFRNINAVDIPFGILPVGTGNSLTRDIIEHNGNLEDFIRLIKDGNTRKIDVAKVKNSKEEFYYANTMGIGYVSDVNITANKIKLFGKLSYTLGVLYHIIKLKTYPVKMTCDDQEISLNNVFISFSNSRYTGGDYLLAPGAKINDGLIDLIIVNKLSRINLLKTFPKIFTGKHVETRFVDTLKAKNIKIETLTNKFLSPDGELFGQTPVEISCIPEAIRVFSQ
jgi:diacylglycerol kinase (ATP)